MTQPNSSRYHQVKAHCTARLAPSAGIVGDVTLGQEVTILAGAQLRGDDAPIVIGSQSNVQENAVIHVSINGPTIIGDRTTVGHGAIVHGCEIGENVLVGMGSIIMSGAKIGSNSVVAAGALVSENKEFPTNSLIMGVPAKVARSLSPDEVQNLCDVAWKEYVQVGADMLEAGLLAHPPAEMTVHAG